MTPVPLCNHGLCSHGVAIAACITCHLCRFDELLADLPLIPSATRIVLNDGRPSFAGTIDDLLGEKNHDDERPAAGRADRAADDTRILVGDHRRDSDRIALTGLRLDTAQARLECARARAGSSIDGIADHMARLRDFRAARDA